MKRGTTPALKVTIGLDIGDIEKVDFMFKQDCNENCRVKLKKTYPSRDVAYTDGAFRVQFTDAETRIFAPNRAFYMDARPVLVGGAIPATQIVALKMSPTLFKEGEDD